MWTLDAKSPKWKSLISANAKYIHLTIWMRERWKQPNYTFLISRWLYGLNGSVSPEFYDLTILQYRCSLQRRHMGLSASQITGKWTVCFTVCSTGNIENIKAQYCRRFMELMRQWPGGIRCKSMCLHRFDDIFNMSPWPYSILVHIVGRFRTSAKPSSESRMSSWIW